MVEMVYLLPAEVPFDASKIEEYLLRQPFTFRDPVDPKGPFLMCGNAAFADYARQKRLAGGAFPYVCVVSVDPQQIAIRQLCEEEELAQARKFIEWMLDWYPCRVLDDNGNDWTEACRQSVDVLYKD